MSMEEMKKKSADEMDREIYFSNSIKAGKRIYYVDVKKTRKDEMYLSITESKKIVVGEGDNATVTYDKHKIFLYQEDFQKFMAGLQEAIDFIAKEAIFSCISTPTISLLHLLEIIIGTTPLPVQKSTILLSLKRIVE